MTHNKKLYSYKKKEFYNCADGRGKDFKENERIEP